MPVTRWDTRGAARAALAAAVGLGLAWLLTAATDEGGVGWGERAARTVPLTPLFAALGCWASLGSARARGEILALQALGRSTLQTVASSVVGGAALPTVAAAFAMAAPGFDLRAFFPRAAPPSEWVWQSGAFVDRAAGLRVAADGVPVRIRPEAAIGALAIPEHGRAAAALAIAAAGWALPLLLAHALVSTPRSAPAAARARALRGGVGPAVAAAAALVATLACFQATAARSLPALADVAPSVALLAFAVRRYRSQP